eukprot:6187231-Pleurochrysis_carterae.AAC.1
MFRYDENAVQPENGCKAYFDRDAAAKQRERWRLEELEATEYERNRERYADEMFPEALATHPDDRSSIGSRDSSASSECSDCSNERAAPSPAAGDDVTMPIIIDDADMAAPTDAQTQQSAPSPTELDTADRTPAGRAVPPAGSAPDARPLTTASFQRIDHHRNTWPMVSLMANVVMVTAA